MFNPFKKKDNEFKLDETPLPSLGDSTSSEPQLDVPTPTNNLDSFPSQNYNPNLANNNFNSTPPISTQNFQQIPAMNSISDSQGISQNNMKDDLIKAKLDSIEAKVTLFDARLNSIEQKLDVIFKLVHNEVSDETKRKIKVGQMVEQMKSENPSNL